MVLKSVLFFYLIINSTCAYDFFRDAINLIDQSSDPCDDFYRHACPVGDYDFLVLMKYAPIFKELETSQEESAWENLKIEEALNNIKPGEIENEISAYFERVFLDMCQNNDPAMTTFLLRTQQMLSHEMSTKCRAENCLLRLGGDSNCTRAANDFKSRVAKKTDSSHYQEYVLKLRENIAGWKNKTRAVNILLDGNFKVGVDNINSFLMNMVDVLLQWIQVYKYIAKNPFELILQETPWVNDQKINRALEAVARDLFVIDEYGIQLRENIDALMKTEQDFLKCSADFSGKHDLFCSIYSYHFMFNGRTTTVLHFGYDATNRHPYIYFGMPFIARAANSEMAANLGLAGYVVGHELSHSLIENPSKSYLLPYSSAEAINCIQTQYNNTCAEFKEV
ncbi:Peptidase_M13 domain-containing protein [Caenorhabditis elegans]|uniref:Peptidase_M13 domain-containing protein n=1 Tax=Caenorhabditis elegans TaxID=6239 RepID=H2KZE5_CAEEL|nr:Peptidase_M13 domain-containing protein [Caenorhabditis elegans]CCD67902.1 Peptidase_M13 domain-containing protein [Caenorhabditis elegans]|eukprot:NP_001129930.1 Uncharacterized protein CELE_F41C6.4 [Caenorhabditis elegans]